MKINIEVKNFPLEELNFQEYIHCEYILNFFFMYLQSFWYFQSKSGAGVLVASTF